MLILTGDVNHISGIIKISIASPSSHIPLRRTTLIARAAPGRTWCRWRTAPYRLFQPLL